MLELSPDMPNNPFSLNGQRALVTGSSQGLGLAMARGLAAAGATVVLNGRDPDKLERAATNLRDAGHAVAVAAFDVCDAGAAAAACASLGPVDILVNNAGIQRRGPAAALPLEDWNAVLQTNLTSAFNLTRAVVGTMIERKQGKIINVCSIMSEVSRPTIAPYAASKGGLKMLTKAMAVEWGPHNIQVNGIGPGYMVTDLNQPLIANPEFDSWVRKRTPLGRWGQPEELAGTVVFLASPASDFMTGQILYVDGGILAAL